MQIVDVSLPNQFAQNEIQSCRFIAATITRAARIATYALLVLSFGLIVLGKPASLPRCVSSWFEDEHKGREQKGSLQLNPRALSCHMYYVYVSNL